MHCPYCEGEHTDVVETRVGEDWSIRRRRNCVICNKRFTTYERVENVTLLVKKKDGRREQFSRDKLKSGLIKACEKTNISLAQIDTVAAEIEREFRCGESVEIDSRMIGQAIADRLKALDKIAYIRFASVFKRFVDVEEFEQEVKRLIQ